MTTKTGKFTLSENWSNKSGKVRQKADKLNKDELQEDLRELRLNIENEFLKVPDKTNLTKDWLKITVDKYWNPEKYEEKKMNLFGFIESYIELSKNRINPATGKKISESTIKKVWDMFSSFKRICHY